MEQATPIRPKLFRQASLQARAFAWEGRPSLALGVPATFTTIGALMLVGALAALVTLGGYARHVDLNGAMLPAAGVIAISAPASGWIEMLAVKEGATVEKGTPLYTLDVDTETKGGDVQQLVADVLRPERKMYGDQIQQKIQLRHDTEQHLQQTIDNINRQIVQADTQIHTSENFFQTINKEYQLYLTMLENRQVPRSDFDSHQQIWMRAQTQLQDLQSGKLKLVGQLNDAQYQLSTIATKTGNEIDALRAKISDIDEKLAVGEGHRSVLIRAPGAGIVTDVTAHPGQVIKAGSPMLTIVPKGEPMQAVLLAPSRAIGFIHTGQRVLLRYSAFPYQKYGEHPGTVASVARASLDSSEARSLLGDDPAADLRSGPYYRIIVDPDEQFVAAGGQKRALPANMRVEAYVLLDWRRLYQWVMQPLYAFARTAHQS